MNWNVWIAYGVVALIMIVSIVRGHHYGFLRTAFSMLSIVISILLISVMNPYVHSAVETVGVPKIIYTTVYNTMVNKVPDLLREQNNEEITKQQAEEWTRGSSLDGDQQRQWMDEVNIPEWAQKAVFTGEEKAAAALAETVSTYLSEFLSTLLSYVLCFLIVYILLKIISSFLGIVNHIPIIGGVNRTLGGWLGFIKGLFILWILSLLLTLFAVTPWGAYAIRVIESSKPLAVLYHILISVVK